MRRPKRYLSNYKPSTVFFPEKLVQNKKISWTPVVDFQTAPFIQCLYFLLHGESITETKDGRRELEHLKKEIIRQDDIWTIHTEIIERIVKYYSISVDIYHPLPIPHGRAIQFAYSIGNGEKRIAMLNYTISDCWHSYLALIPNLQSKLPILAKRYCCACGSWLGHSFFIKHNDNCFKCPCGSHYWKGSDHLQLCQTAANLTGKRKDPTDICHIQKQKQKGKEFDIYGCYFGDLETLVDGVYKVYAACCLDWKLQSTEYSIWIGPNSLDSFIDRIIEVYSGTFWFFNGSRFDCFFLLNRFIERKIKVTGIIQQQKSFTSFTVKTNRGYVTFRDLSRFLFGSLADNCASFGIANDLSKKDFDHSKISNWNDVNIHSKEILDYLSHDVISLREVYKAYAKTIYEAYRIKVKDFVTGSHLGYAAFTTFLPKNRILLRRIAKKDEDIVRAFYRGGRVHCGRRIWKSDSWDEIKAKMTDSLVYDEEFKVYFPFGYEISQELYDSIDDYLVDTDCNSLYPAAQYGRKYPVGTYKVWEIDQGSEIEHLLLWQYHTRGFNKKKVKQQLKDFWFKSAFEVDITCPNDLCIPFLITSEDGKVKQNLFPKTKKWWTGPELWEASKLGYKISRIYSYITWDRYENIFDQFVFQTYERKKKAKREGNKPQYAESKSTLVSVTGKFAQRNDLTKVHLYLPDDEIKEPVSDLTEIENSEGETIAWFGKSNQEYQYSAYPIQLSSFILGWSRVIMSRYLRKMTWMKKPQDGVETPKEKLARTKGGYLSIQLCPLYGDTDSLFIHRKMWEYLEDDFKSDDELGKFKSEIDGKIIAIIVLSPKVYHVVYVDRKTRKLKSIMRSKGVPHSGAPYEAFEAYPRIDEDFVKVFEEYGFMKNRNSTREYHPKVDIKKRSYVFKDEDENISHISTKIPFDYLEKVALGDFTMECIYGSMIRNFSCGIPSETFITPDFRIRDIKRNDWWSSGEKIHLTDYLYYPTSLPLGHYMLNSNK